MKIRTHFKHNVFMLNEAGELLEHLGGTEDYLLAAELYEVALRRFPEARIQMREGGLSMTTSGVWWCSKRTRWARPCAASCTGIHRSLIPA
jgi:hypothetical protein